MWGTQNGTDDLDKRALMQQLGGVGAALGPASNKMPIREAPLPAPVATDDPMAGQLPSPGNPADALPPKMPLPAEAPPTQPMVQEQPEGAGIGALAGLLQQGRPPLPPPPTPQNIGSAIQGVGHALKPKNVLNALKPKNVGNALRNPLVALGGLFGRRR